MRLEHLNTALLGAALLLVGAQSVNAGVIRGAVGVLSNSMGTGDGSIANTFNQTGLSAAYVSGVTDYDTYVATHPTNNSANAWASPRGPALGFIDYDLGAVFNLTSFALWTQNNINGIRDFEILVDGILAGSFVAAQEAAANIAVQKFDFAALSGQVVRLNVLSIYGGLNVNIGEVAFESDVAAVPMPAPLALVGLGILGLGLHRRA